MGLLDSTLDIGAAAIAGAITSVGIATGAPGTDGLSNQSAAAKQTVAWSTPSGGDFHNTADLVFTGGAANGPVAYLTLWAGSTYRGYKAISGGSDTSFNAAGEYTVPSSSITLTGSSTT